MYTFGILFLQDLVLKKGDALLSVDVLISISRREGLPFPIIDGINAGGT
jgi:hypothetical protein